MESIATKHDQKTSGKEGH
jgi:hypothetical protein